MLRRALGICAASLLLFAAASSAQDDFEDPDEILLPGELAEADTGPDFARIGFYIQGGYSYGIERNLESKLNDKLSLARLAPQESQQLQRNPDKPIQPDGTIPLIATPGLPFEAQYGLNPLGEASVSNSSGLNIRAGSRVLPNLAVEMQLEWMGGFDVDIPGFSQPAPPPLLPPLTANGTQILIPTQYLQDSPSDKVELDLLALTVNLKIPLLLGRIQPYGLIGGGAIFVFRDGRFPRSEIVASLASSDPTTFEELVDVRDVGAVVRMGGGVDAYINEHVYVSTEFTWVAAMGSSMRDLRYWGLSMGVGYRF